MTAFLNYVWRLWFVVVALIATMFCGPFVYLFSFRAAWFRRSYFFMRLWCLIIFYGMGFRYKLHRETDERLEPELQYILISNHTSIMDIMLMCILHPHHPICFVGKKELEKIPVFGTVYRRVCVMVDRSSLRSRARVYKLCAQRMAAGQNIVIFPEGGVPDDTSVVLAPFKDGAFTLSARHRFPIAVYTFRGLKEMFPFSLSKGYPGTVDVYLNAVLAPAAEEELKKEAYSLMLRSLGDEF